MNTETKETRKSFHPLRTLLLLILLLAAVAAACRLLLWRDGQPPHLAGDADRPPLSGLSRLSALYADGAADDTYASLRKLAEKEPEAVSFVRGWDAGRAGRYAAAELDLSADCAPGVLPYLLQWDARWGYADYGSGALGLTGCGPTCLSMVVVGLTGNRDANPLAVAEYSSRSGWYVSGAGTSWELMRSGAEHYGLLWEELPLDDDVLRAALDGGRPVVASMLPGDFTESGHYIVIEGYEDGGYRVLDPNSPTRSAKLWSYETLRGQIGNLWAYSAAV